MFDGFSAVFVAMVAPVRMWARYRKSHRRIFRNFSTQSTHLDLKFMFGGFWVVLVALVAPVRKWVHRAHFGYFCTEKCTVEFFATYAPNPLIWT